MAAVEFENVTIHYPGAEAPSVSGLNLDIADGEFLVLVGPSGCGKSTTLRSLAGLEPVSQGRILIDGVDVSDKEPKERDIAMVFQNYALYPHMTVEKNMGFALSLAKVDKAEIARRVREAADILDLGEFLDRKPKQLSGGQRQRVAMGRAIVREPKVFLMDEPLSNLDAKLRVQTRTQVAQLQRRLGVTTVYVTHDQVEAMTMGDRVAVLNKGVLQQVAPPRELYDHPVNAFVAGFIGSPAMNLLTVAYSNGAAQIAGTALPVAVPGGRDRVTVGIRPEHCSLVRSVGPQAGAGDGAGPEAFRGGASTVPAEGRFAATVELVEELGSDAYAYTTIDGAAEPFICRLGSDIPQVGERVQIGVDGERIHLFDAETGVSLRS